MSPRLQVQGELSFAVQDGGDSASGSITGQGSVVRVHTDKPAVALRDLLGAGSAALLPTALQQLADDGLTVVLDGPRGEVARAGAGVDSVAGRLLVGTRLVRPGRPAALAPLAGARLRDAGRGPLVAVAAGLLLAGLLARRRRT